MGEYNIDNYEKVAETKDQMSCLTCALFSEYLGECMVESDDSFDCTPRDGVDYKFVKKIKK